MTGKYERLEKDPSMKRWIQSLARGSQATAEVALRRLGRTCELMETSPQMLVERGRRDPMGLQDSIEDLVTALESKGKSPGYIEGILKTMKSWLRYNNVILARRIKIRNVRSTPTIEDEQVPSQAELSRIFRASPPRVRVAEALIALSDLRPGSIGNNDGSDGITLKDLPELRIERRKVSFEKIPTRIVVRSNLSKAGHKYFTFLPSEGCTYLKEYLEERIRAGERLKPESPLVAHERGAAKPFMMARKITHFIRKYMRNAGVRKRPYVLRAYAETQLIIAESKGAISHPYLQFIAGHKGDIEARYSTNKGRLPPNMIEDIREAYKRCEPFLSTIAQPIEQSSMVKEAKIEMLRSLAKNLLGLDLLEVKVEKEKELKRELRQEEEIELFEGEIRKLRIEPVKFREERRNSDADCGFVSKLISEDEVVKFLNDGWSLVKELKSGKVVVRKKT
jgi:hypothetical protein